MTKKRRIILILSIVLVVAAVTVTTLWVLSKKVQTKIIPQEQLVLEFLGRDIPTEAVIHSEFQNTDTASDLCLVIDGMICKDFIETIDYCDNNTLKGVDLKDTYDNYLNKFSFLNNYAYDDITDHTKLYRHCASVVGIGFMETVQDPHHPIYVFSYGNEENQQLIVCSRLPYPVEVS